jgi:hypothetical protein
MSEQTDSGANIPDMGIIPPGYRGGGYTNPEFGGDPDFEGPDLRDPYAHVDPSETLFPGYDPNRADPLSPDYDPTYDPTAAYGPAQDDGLDQGDPSGGDSGGDDPSSGTAGDDDPGYVADTEDDGGDDGGYTADEGDDSGDVGDDSGGNMW